MICAGDEAEFICRFDMVLERKMGRGLYAAVPKAVLDGVKVYS